MNRVETGSGSVPQLRTTVRAPKDLDGARNTHQFRLSMIAPETSAGRSASSYRPFQAGAAAQPTVQAAGAGGPAAFSARSARSAHAKAGEVARLNLNKASAQQLADNLPGIGPAYAKKIIAARPVKSLDQLIAIRGLSPLMVESIRGLVEW
ncbi:hypothetical protein GC170_00510 [bacterium]|nr:hypothetical protein [bacterium]